MFVGRFPNNSNIMQNINIYIENIITFFQLIFKIFKKKYQKCQVLYPHISKHNIFQRPDFSHVGGSKMIFLKTTTSVVTKLGGGSL